MQSQDERSELQALLKRKSIFFGDFTLASGAKSSVYFDCRLTTMDGRGAALIGSLMHALIRREAAARQLQIDGVGGLTLGADPVALAVAIHSHAAGEAKPLNAFSVRKTPKAHGQGKRVEGNFKSGDTVVVLDDVVTRGDSTIAAIEAVIQEGGKVALVAVLLDRQEGGRDKIEKLGYPVVSLFQRTDLLDK